MHRYSSAVAPGSPGPVAAEPSLTGQSSHDQSQTRTYFRVGKRVERLMLAAARHRRKAPARKKGTPGAQDCLRSAIQVNGWVAPAGVMCSSRSWLTMSHLAPSWRASWAGL